MTYCANASWSSTAQWAPCSRICNSPKSSSAASTSPTIRPLCKGATTSCQSPGRKPSSTYISRSCAPAPTSSRPTPSTPPPSPWPTTASSPRFATINLAAARARAASARTVPAETPDAAIRFVAGIHRSPPTATLALPDVERPGLSRHHVRQLAEAPTTSRLSRLMDGGVDICSRDETSTTPSTSRPPSSPSSSSFEPRRPPGAGHELGDHHRPQRANALGPDGRGVLARSTREHGPLCTVGINCALGPEHMRPHTSRTLLRISSPLHGVRPQRRPAQRVRRLRPHTRTRWPRSSASSRATAGSTSWAAAAAPRPEHIRAIAEAVRGLTPATRRLRRRLTAQRPGSAHHPLPNRTSP